jgi:hypothetical protein
MRAPVRSGFRALMRPVLALGLALGLAACAAEEVWAPDEVVSQARYVPSGPAKIQLLTMISNRNGSGGHSALLIDGPERVLFDPAGSWRHPMAPERNDVIYGVSPQLYDFYMDYHARETYHVVVQELDVSPGQAAALIELVEALRVHLGGSPFALGLLARQLAGTADGLGLLARLLLGRLLEMLLELHLAENAFTLQLLLQGTERLIDIVVANTDLHVVVTTFLS